ncbi:MAG TPA: Asp23/Gls24 family envelope stress response protein [Acidimicrobiales bacterium]|nr:Asp23/Gls24 family envelope stress response protein [Acidimicrobiales bacterium]
MTQTTTPPPTGSPSPNDLVTPQGKTTIADSVVAKIAGMAAREVAGVHEMGKGAARAFGALKEKLPVGSSEPSVTQGVAVEVGERQAAIELDLVCEYGVPIVDVAQAVRRNVIQRLQAMTGLEVTEVNITVDDIWMGDEEQEEPPAPPRVQ